MSFREGSNRLAVHSVLSDVPITKELIMETTGLSEGAVESVLRQIGRDGYAKQLKSKTGPDTYTKGEDAIKKKRKSRRSKAGDIIVKLRAYISDHIGKEINTKTLQRKLRLKSMIQARRFLNEWANEDYLTMTKNRHPRTWMVNKAIDDKGTSRLQTTKSQQKEIVPPQLIPLADSLPVNDAINQLIQMQQQNRLYQQAFQQILNGYEMISNGLESVGVIVEE